MSKRWVRVGLLAFAVFVVNGLSRLVTWKAGIVDESEQLRIGFVALAFVVVLLLGASAWWAVRYPFGRLLADLGAACLAAGLLCVFVGPFLGGSSPFAGGLGYFMGQVLLFIALAAVGIFGGFMIVVAFGKDWKSRGLRRYEENYAKRPHRAVGR